MAIGAVTIGQTPCCGVIERTYETWISSAGTVRHNPSEIIKRTNEDGSAYYEDYAPTFPEETAQIDRGVCPDCGNIF